MVLIKLVFCVTGRIGFVLSDLTPPHQELRVRVMFMKVFNSKVLFRALVANQTWVPGWTGHVTALLFKYVHSKMHSNKQDI